MSEYQYYEFAAVDHPLTPRQQAELRGYSTRASITASSFTNEYHWGDLKGDPLDWMRRYFDAHVYSANWGSCRLMLRLPRAALDKADLAPFTRRSQVGARSDFVDAFAVTATPEHWILEWSFNDDSGEIERFWSQADGPGWMARLLPLRDELLRGDARPLYLGWLARVGNNELADADEEPPVPPGLNGLTPAQAALADFLLLDPDWQAAAAEAGPAPMELTEASAMDAWLAELPPASMRSTLRLLLESRGQEAERGLRQEFLTWLRDQQGSTAGSPHRDVAAIEARSQVCETERLARERRLRSAAEARRQADRARALAQLAERAGEAWSAIDHSLQRGSGAAYDQALEAVQILAEALASVGRDAEFREGLARLMSAHHKRGAWVSRLAKAGLQWAPE
jgi:hypothetical protein